MDNKLPRITWSLILGLIVLSVGFGVRAIYQINQIKALTQDSDAKITAIYNYIGQSLQAQQQAQQPK